MNRTLPAVVLCLLAAASSGHAASDSRYAVKGVGLAPCEHFVAEKSKQSELYFMYLGWMDGYLTATNMHVAQTFDITPWQPTQLLATLIESHCAGNPQITFGAVMEAVTAGLFIDRLQEPSEVVEARHGDQALKIYRSVVRRIQRILADEGYYSGPIDGDYGSATRLAVEAFQLENRITVTGLPDNMTLFQIFDRSSD